MAVAHTTGRLRSAEWASQALARLARPAAAPCRHSARRLAARAAGASPADKGAASGAPAPAQRNSRTSRTIPLATTAHRELELGPANLMSQYREQKQAAARGGGTPFVLPLLVLPLCELPTKTLTLPVPEEACYSRMFALVDSSASRLFGACLADPATQSMESVGALCELTHLVRSDQPGQPPLLVTARVVGRFVTTQLLAAEPFVTVQAEAYNDCAPRDEWEALQLAAQEQRVWQELIQVFQLGDKVVDLLSARLAARLEGAMENEELLRWSPSSVARSAVRAAPGPDPSVLARVEALGLLGDPATLAQRTTEHLCLDALHPVSEDQRRERWSFALASTLGMDLPQQQQLLYNQSTSERLHAAEQVLLEWRGHLAACSSLRDL